MATTLTNTEQVRLRNLLLVHGRQPGLGAPTSDHLVQVLSDGGVLINRTELSDIYWGKKPVTNYLASGVERAMHLPSGWLSEDYEFLFQASPGEVAAYRSLASLPAKVRQAVMQLIHECAAQNETPRASGDA